MSEMIIREYIPEKNHEDMEHLLHAYMTIWNHPENLKFMSYSLKPYDEGTIKKLLSNHIEVGVHYYAATKSDKDICAIAVVGASTIDGFEIVGFGTHHECKRKGIGTRLLKYVLDIAASNDFKAVDTLTFADNIIMLRLLLSMSFIPVNMAYNRRADGGDLLHMRKQL